MSSKVPRAPPARSGSAETPARGTLPHRRGLRCTPRATPGFPASCPGSQSAGSSSSSETSESTRTVREAQLAAEDFLQPLGGDRCIDPGRAWISVAQEVLNVFEVHTAVREGDADGMAESVEGQRACNTRGLQVTTEDPLGRDIVQAPCSATHDRNKYNPWRAARPSHEPPLQRLNCGIGDRLKVLTAPFACYSHLTPIEEQVIQFYSNNLRNAKRR